MPRKKNATVEIRQPSQRAALEQFVAGPSNVQPLRPSDVRMPDHKPSKRGVVTRADGRQRRRMTIYLPPSLAKELQVYAITHDLEMSSLVANAVTAYLESA